MSAIPAPSVRPVRPAPPRPAPDRVARLAGKPADRWGAIVAEGRAARAQADGGRWRIGHLADTVERRYRSGGLQRFAEDIGEAYGTVRRYRWVVNRYEPGIRFRFPVLSFSHFQAVAGLPSRVHWLERAELGAWSVDRLIRESRSVGEAAGPQAVARLRGALGGVARGLDALGGMDDRALRAAGEAWLSEALQEVRERVAAVQTRLAQVSRAKTTSLNRYKVTGGKRASASRARGAGGKPKAASARTPVNPF
jgi:hypothetical protein